MSSVSYDAEYRRQCICARQPYHSWIFCCRRSVRNKCGSSRGPRDDYGCCKSGVQGVIEQGCHVPVYGNRFRCSVSHNCTAFRFCCADIDRYQDYPDANGERQKGLAFSLCGLSRQGHIHRWPCPRLPGQSQASVIAIKARFSTSCARTATIIHSLRLENISEVRQTYDEGMSLGQFAVLIHPSMRKGGLEPHCCLVAITSSNVAGSGSDLSKAKTVPPIA